MGQARSSRGSAFGRWPLLSLFATREALSESPELLSNCKTHDVQIEVVSNQRLVELCKSTEHQGLIARMGLYPYSTMQSLADRLRRAKQQTEQVDAPNKSSLLPLIVVCDRIQDTFNFGAILRCCDGACALAVIVGEHGQAEVTPHVARSSVGAVHHVEVVRASSIADALSQLKQLEFQVIAADGNSTSSLWTTSLNQPTALVIGSEAYGVSPSVAYVRSTHLHSHVRPSHFVECCRCRWRAPLRDS